MPDLYYLPRSIDSFSATDSCFFLKFTYKGDPFYLPFFAYYADLVNAHSEGFTCDTDCLYSMSDLTIKNFILHSEEGTDISELSYLDSYFDMEDWVSYQEDFEDMKKVVSVAHAFDEMSAEHLEGFLTVSKEYLDYASNGGQDILRQHILKTLHPYFPELCSPFLPGAPNTFL